MAARRPKPPGNLTNSANLSPDDSNETADVKINFHNPDSEGHRQIRQDNNINSSRKSSNCKCTNISIMHLFHEMKQQFPTVPDPIVNQYVNDNCHNRENCILNLRNELDLNPMPVQAYPSKALRSQQILRKTNGGGENAAAADTTNSALSSTTSPSTPPPSLLASPQDSNSKIIANSNQSHNGIGEFNLKEQLSHKRPTTLDLNQNRNESEKSYQRNLRKPPLPPSITKNQSSTPMQRENLGEPSEVSVNISLSPGASRLNQQREINEKTRILSPVGTPLTQQQQQQQQRHRSFISVQPESSYSRAFLSSPTNNQKSFTSVNLTLRQPTNSLQPNSTIDISAGPGPSGLSYSSTSYDARRGYQKNFHITVTDEGGVFSASRIRPSSCYCPSVHHSEEEFIGNRFNSLRPATSEHNVRESVIEPPDNNLRKNNHQQGDYLRNEFSDVLERQLERKEKLSNSLRDNKKRLLQVQEEIEMLIRPIDSNESEQLDNDIKKLRCDCQIMLNEIENWKRNVFGSNDDDVNFNSMNNMQQPFPRHKPPPRPSISSQQTSFNQNHHDQRFDTIMQHRNRSHRLLQQQQQLQQRNSSTDEEEFSDANSSEEECPKWACEMCTFQNHPLLNKCECCDNVRIIPETMAAREDIHITLSPGENRIIHSWIVS